MSYDYDKPIKNFKRKEYNYRTRSTHLAEDALEQSYLSVKEKRLLREWSNDYSDRDIAKLLGVTVGYVTSILSKIWKKIHWHEENGFKFVSHRTAIWMKRRKMTGKRSLMAALREGFRWDNGTVRVWEFFQILREYGVSPDNYIMEAAFSKVCKDVNESNAKQGYCPEIIALARLKETRDIMAARNGLRKR